MRTLLSGFQANFLPTWVTGAFVLMRAFIVIAFHPYWLVNITNRVLVIRWTESDGRRRTFHPAGAQRD